jgi:hypothetical protein
MIDQLIQSGHRHKRSKKHFAAQQTSVKIAANDCFPPKMTTAALASYKLS